MALKRRELRTENKRAVLDSVIERFLAESIAAAKQGLRAAVVEGKGPHPVEAVWQIASPLAKAMKEHFRVRVRCDK